MRWAELVLDYLRVLAWPGAVVILLLVFRKRLQEGFGKLPAEGSAEITGLGKYSWKRHVEEVAVEAATLGTTVGQGAGEESSSALETGSAERSSAAWESTDFESRLGMASHMAGANLDMDWEALRSLAVRHPEASVLRTWQRVEYLLYAFAYSEKAPIAENWRDDIGRVARYLGADARTAAALADLQELTRAVEAGQDVSRSSALTFVDAAEQAMRHWASTRRA
jgi:hypothetical protein